VPKAAGRHQLVLAAEVLIERRLRRVGFCQVTHFQARPPSSGAIGAFTEFIAIKEDDVAIKPTALTIVDLAATHNTRFFS
jgi:NADPH:quinone reductase-like Zn-dependent oxidoreductase